MTDREKKIKELCIDCLNLPVPYPSLMKATLSAFVLLLEDDSNWQPSSRPCFDKPAGVPIEHWETL